MWHHPAWLIAGLFAMAAIPLQQDKASVTATRLVSFERWSPAFPPATQPSTTPVPISTGSGRQSHALIGGAIGAVGGVVVCTVISNLANDSAGGFSTCTLKGYFLTGGAGFGVGFALGSIL